MQLRVLFLLHLNLFPKHSSSSFSTVWIFIWKLPVSDKVLKLLEWDLARVFQCQSAILSEVVKVLKVILLDIVEEIVHQHRAGHEGEGKDGGTVSHGAVLVKRTLCVHQRHRHLPARRGFHQEDLIPHQYASCVSLHTAPPVKPVKITAFRTQPILTTSTLQIF